MPATDFPEYARLLTHLLNSVVATAQARIENLQIDQRSMLRGFVSDTLVFEDDRQLHFREFIDLTLVEPRMDYAYHYQNAENDLIFRYDNAAHRPALSQAEHKHTLAGVNTSGAPTLTQVIDEILGA